MELIKQGKLEILKGEKTVKITSQEPISSNDIELWDFVDALILKGYKLISVNDAFGTTNVVLIKE